MTLKCKKVKITTLSPDKTSKKLLIINNEKLITAKFTIKKC